MEKASSTLSVNWPYLMIVAVFGTTGLGFIGWAVSSQVFRERSRHELFGGGWSWSLAVVFDGMLLAVLIALFWKIYRDANTYISEEELSQLTVLGWKRIRWTDVTRVDRVGFGYHVFSPKQKIVLTPYAYRHPDSLLTLVQRYLANAKGLDTSHHDQTAG